MTIINALRDYDTTTAALVAHDELHDPQRAALLRQMFDAQRALFHHVVQSMDDNNNAVRSLAERVQGHISKQLIDVIDAQAEAGRQHAQILLRLGVQDVVMKTTHDNIVGIAQILHRQYQTNSYLPPAGHDDPSEDHP